MTIVILLSNVVVVAAKIRTVLNTFITIAFRRRAKTILNRRNNNVVIRRKRTKLYALSVDIFNSRKMML